MLPHVKMNIKHDMGELFIKLSMRLRLSLVGVYTCSTNNILWNVVIDHFNIMLLPECMVRPVVSVSALVWYIRYYQYGILNKDNVCCTNRY
jgi:hypothetical protein